MNDIYNTNFIYKRVKGLNLCKIQNYKQTSISIKKIKTKYKVTNWLIVHPELL